MKYKLIHATDKLGNDKSLSEFESAHPSMTGEAYNFDIFKESVEMGNQPCFMFIWDDDSNKVLRTSNVEKVIERNNGFTIITMNSVYEFEEVK